MYFGDIPTFGLGSSNTLLIGVFNHECEISVIWDIEYDLLSFAVNKKPHCLLLSERAMRLKLRPDIKRQQKPSIYARSCCRPCSKPGGGCNFQLSFRLEPSVISRKPKEQLFLTDLLIIQVLMKLSAHNSVLY